MAYNGRHEKKKTKKINTWFLIFVLELAMFFAGYSFGSCSSKMTETEKKMSVEETAPPKTEQECEKIVQEMLMDMSLSDMIYQMMFVTPESITNVPTVVAAGETTKNALQTYPVGGIVYFAQNFETRTQTIEMIQNTQSYSNIPLFISVDEEGGLVSRLGQNSAMGITKHPPMREIGNTGDSQKAYEVGNTIGAELKTLGFNVDFAPVADVLIHPDNREIGNRSFGENPETVSVMVESTVKGLQDGGLCATLKHFPGHGSTYVDTHTGYSESNRTAEQLRENEFLPFRRGIAAGADFVMVSHMTLVNATQEKVPSSISKEVITDMLRTELQFEGIIITDSFSMGAITDEFEGGKAAVKAVQAGADMILMPANVKTAHDAIYQAVQSGEISEETIKTAVHRILTVKLKRNIIP